MAGCLICFSSSAELFYQWHLHEETLSDFKAYSLPYNWMCVYTVNHLSWLAWESWLTITLIWVYLRVEVVFWNHSGSQERLLLLTDKSWGIVQGILAANPKTQPMIIVRKHNFLFSFYSTCDTNKDPVEGLQMETLDRIGFWGSVLWCHIFHRDVSFFCSDLSMIRTLPGKITGVSFESTFLMVITYALIFLLEFLSTKLFNQTVSS